MKNTRNVFFLLSSLVAVFFSYAMELDQLDKNQGNSFVSKNSHNLNFVTSGFVVYFNPENREPYWMKCPVPWCKTLLTTVKSEKNGIEMIKGYIRKHFLHMHGIKCRLKKENIKFKLTNCRLEEKGDIAKKRKRREKGQLRLLKRNALETLWLLEQERNKTKLSC